MANRGAGYGLDAELARKANLKYDHAAEAEAAAWISGVTGVDSKTFPSFSAYLKDGQVLCMLINAIKPGTIRKIETSRMPFKQMENISNFLKACRVLGVAEHDLFETVDLYDEKDLGVVVMCIHALGGTVQKTQPQFAGPHLGKKKSGGSAPPSIPKKAAYSGATKISMGSSQTMARSEIRQVMNPTFGAKASGTGTSSVISRQNIGSSQTMARSEISTSNSVTFGADASLPKPSPTVTVTAKPPAPPVRKWGSNQRPNPNPTYMNPVNSANDNNRVVVGGGVTAGKARGGGYGVTAGKARGGGYGMDAELARKAELKYDVGLEREAQAWIESVTGAPFPGGLSFADALKDGVILANFINKLQPNTISRVNNSKMPFKQMENISNFLKGARALGVNEHDLFETVDLFEAKDLGVVVMCIHALGRAAQKSGLGGGHILGAKESTQNVRVFSEAQKRQSRLDAGVTKLSMGSSQTMDRTYISTNNSNTFGADTVGTGSSSAVSKLNQGSSGIMQRSEVSTSNNITFGAEKAGTGSSNVVSKVSEGSSGVMQRSEISTSNNITFGAEKSGGGDGGGGGGGSRGGGGKPILARVEYSYTAQEAGELSIKEGELIKIMNSDDTGGWWDGCNSAGNKGSFPSNYVTLV